jgi:pimeloyl-ACP methyl ester carboxylesterase
MNAGMASMSANWAWVQDELTPEYRVVSSDRAGLGWSEPGTGRLDAAAETARHPVLFVADLSFG